MARPCAPTCMFVDPSRVAGSTDASRAFKKSIETNNGMPTRTLCRSPTASNTRRLNTTTYGLGGIGKAQRENIKPRNEPRDVVDHSLAPVHAHNVGSIVRVAPRTLLGEAVCGKVPSPLPVRDCEADIGKSSVGFHLAHANDPHADVVDLAENEPSHLGVGVVGTGCMALSTGEGVNDIAIVRIEVDTPFGQWQSDMEKEDIEGIRLGSGNRLHQPRKRSIR